VEGHALTQVLLATQKYCLLVGLLMQDMQIVGSSLHWLQVFAQGMQE
jgi:hypothetical protein